MSVRRNASALSAEKWRNPPFAGREVCRSDAAVRPEPSLYTFLLQVGPVVMARGDDAFRFRRGLRAKQSDSRMAVRLMRL